MELIIPVKSYLKMVRYTRSVESEISGLADVNWDKEKENLVVGKVYLLKQEVNTGKTDLDEDDVHRFMVRRIRRGITQTPRLWWHSHYNFSPFFSATDEATIKKLKTNTFMVAICINQAGKMECKAVISEPKKPEKVIDPLPIRITPREPFEPTKKIKEEVARKVSKKKYVVKLPKWKKSFKKNKKFKKSSNGEINRHVIWLPWTVARAKKTMKRKNLIESFDPFLHEWVLEDMISGTIYRAQLTSPVEEWIRDLSGVFTN